MPLKSDDGQAIQMSMPLLVLDGDPKELLTALSHIVFDRNDVVVIMEKQDPTERMKELVEIYTHKANSLDPLKSALMEYTAQPHIVEEIKKNKKHVHNQEKLNRESRSDSGSIIKEMGDLLRESYQKGFARFKPLPHFKRVFDIGKIWINLHLENKAEDEPPEQYRTAIISTLGNSSLVIVKGRPGIGKTMIQKRIAYDWANGELPEYDLVLFARLRDMKNNVQTCLDMAVSWLCDRGYLRKHHKDWLLNQFNSLDLQDFKFRSSKIKSKLQVLILLDGLDEANKQCTELENVLFHSDDMVNLEYSVVLTTRPEMLDNVICPAPIFTINPLTKDQVHEYVVKHFAHTRIQTAEKKAEEFLQKLKSFPMWSIIAQVPLLLSCLCLVADKLSTDTSVELLLKVCQSLAMQRQSVLASDFGERYENICQKSPVIGNLAKMAFSGLTGGYNIEKKAVFSAEDLDIFCVDREKCLEAGLLIPSNDVDGEIDTNYEFLHFTFQELFASLHIFSELYQLDHRLPPRYLEFTTYESRLQSFADQLKDESVKHMATAGYFCSRDSKVLLFFMRNSNQ